MQRRTARQRVRTWTFRAALFLLPAALGAGALWLLRPARSTPSAPAAPAAPPAAQRPTVAGPTAAEIAGVALVAVALPLLVYAMAFAAYGPRREEVAETQLVPHHAPKVLPPYARDLTKREVNAMSEEAFLRLPFEVQIGVGSEKLNQIRRTMEWEKRHLPRIEYRDPNEPLPEMDGEEEEQGW